MTIYTGKKYGVRGPNLMKCGAAGNSGSMKNRVAKDTRVIVFRGRMSYLRGDEAARAFAIAPSICKIFSHAYIE